jgi:chorismate mutase
MPKFMSSHSVPAGVLTREQINQIAQDIITRSGEVPLLAANRKSGTRDALEACRQQIDSLDQRLVKLIQDRARVVQKVGAIKRETHLAVTDPGREQRVIQKAEQLAKGGPLPPEAVGRIYQKLVEEMRNWESGLDATKTDSVEPNIK